MDGDDNFEKIKSDGPLRKDVVAMVANLALANIDYGVLVYENMESCKVFEIRNHPVILNSIAKRCHKLQNYLLIGQMPKCPHNSK